MMHGKFSVAGDGTPGGSIRDRARDFVMQRKWLLVVVLPTLLTWLYFALVAANQYESEAHFLVRTTQAAAPASTGLSAALSLVGGSSGAPNEAASVSDYLSSHDAVDTLRRTEALVTRFRRPEADFFSKLRPADPTPERLLRYYRGQVSVKADTESSITRITVRSFRPQDSFEIINALMRMGEQRVNVLNRRAYEANLKTANDLLREAEAGLSRSQATLTRFRQQRRNIDPQATGQAQIQVVSQLQGALAQLRAQRNAIVSSLSPSSPQAREMDARIAALQNQLGVESGRLTGSSSAIAANLGDYQGLQLRQQFASKRYDDALIGLQRAREQAQRQQLFIVRVVEPNLPVKALYPKSERIVFTVFVALTLCYALGWLIAAGVREHAA